MDTSTEDQQQALPDLGSFTPDIRTQQVSNSKSTVSSNKMANPSNSLNKQYPSRSLKQALALVITIKNLARLCDLRKTQLRTENLECNLY